MEAIYPITALQKNTSEIKAEARKRVVHVTENGRSAYVFMSEEVLDELIEREREDAAWETSVVASIDRGMQDIECGRVYEGWNALEARVSQIRSARQMSAGLRAEVPETTDDKEASYAESA